MSELGKKVNDAIKIMKMAEQDASEREDKLLKVNTYGGGQEIKNTIPELCYSGGKDSDVILHLAKMAGIKYNAVYKNTTIDPSGTIKHAKENGVIVAKPSANFFNLIEKNGLPNRWCRFCCEYLKEYKISDVVIQGIRIEESRKRAERYKEPNYCRIYGTNKKTNIWLPIREWTSKDVEEFIKTENIQCHSLYYDENGKFCVDRRLGCIGCPLASKNKRIKQFLQYPKFIREYAKRLKIFRDNMTQKRREKGMTDEEILTSFWGTDNEYEHIYLTLFCDSIADFQNKTQGLFGKMDCKAFLEDYFGIKM